MIEAVFPSWQDVAERWKVAYDAERALTDAIFDEFAKPTDEQDPIVRHDLKARYREARQQ